MEKFKGTPGPWVLRTEAVDQTVALDIIGDGVMVSSATPWSSDTECDIDKALANANLIAAAPDLLEVLQKMIEDLRMRAVMMGDVDDDGSVALDVSHSVLMRADAAINRALGNNDGDK